MLSSDDDGDGDGDYKPPVKKKATSTKSSKGKSRSNAAVVLTRNTDKILGSRRSESPSGSALMKEKDDALEKMEHELQIYRNNHEMDTTVWVFFILYSVTAI